MYSIIQADNESLDFLGNKKFDLIYIDPPFNTGRTQKGIGSYSDKFDSFADFLKPRLQNAAIRLKKHGSLFVHVDPHESHYVKVWLDEIFGRDGFINEIIWAYDYGGRSKRKWSAKHDCIFWYVKDPSNYTFNYDAMERIPYMAPGLVGKEKAARGKTPTDVWWHTIVPTNGKERNGYPTQKPLGILKRIVEVHSNEGDECLDFFAGSGSFGEACLLQNRNVTLVDQSPVAIVTMKHRLKGYRGN